MERRRFLVQGIVDVDIHDNDDPRPETESVVTTYLARQFQVGLDAYGEGDRLIDFAATQMNFEHVNA